MKSSDILRQIAALPDEEILARLIWGEARGESLDGKCAIANVVLNRMKSNGRYGHGVKGVCLKPWQFSCFNANDPNLQGMISVKGATFKECLSVAKAALRGLLADNTIGATHYFNPKAIPGGWPASWDRTKMLRRSVIGNHQFYREI